MVKSLVKLPLDRDERLALGLPFLVHAALLLLLSCGSLDERISDHFFDEVRGVWPWQHTFWAKWIFHHRARDLVFVLTMSSLILAVVAQARMSLRRFRAPALFVVLSVGLTVGVVGLWKEFSSLPCPWDSIRYGGSIPHYAFPLPYPDGLPLGQGFPGAHAAGAFAFMSLFFAFRPFGRSLAWIGLGAGWTMGMIYGAAQVVRGAHFSSHNLWSGIIAWALICALYFSVFRRKLSPARQDPPG